MNKKILAVIATGVAAPLLALTVIPAADAATNPSVSFTKIQYNSPGTDNRSSVSLYNEWVRLTNNTSATINLKGWTVRDKAGHVYTFKTYNLGKGKRVYVHTGRGNDGKPDAQHVYQNSGLYIWNNNGDTATLRNAKGKTIDTCSWKTGNTPTYC